MAFADFDVEELFEEAQAPRGINLPFSSAFATDVVRRHDGDNSGFSVVLYPNQSLVQFDGFGNEGARWLKALDEPRRLAQRELLRERRELSSHRRLDLWRRMELIRWRRDRARRSRVFVQLSDSLSRALAFHCSVIEAIDNSFALLKTDTTAVVAGNGRPSGRQLKNAQNVRQSDIGSVEMARRFRLLERFRKFSHRQVVDMRVRYAAGNESQYALAREFGTNQAVVSQIVSGSTYKSAGGPLHRPTPRAVYSAAVVYFQPPSTNAVDPSAGIRKS